MIGPAAMNGPTPGIASAPMPASSPSVPPMAPPAAAPVVVPSGALVCFSCAKVPGALIVGQQHRDIGVREAVDHERIDARSAWPIVG